MTNKLSGNVGEEAVCEKVPCPNCGKALMRLPPGYPLFDVRCTGCTFRAQVKTNNTQPKKEILGAGWDILQKFLKTGGQVPPLIANFVWEDKTNSHQEIRFYPFVPRKALKSYRLSQKAVRANYRMFRYTNLDILPFFILYQS